MSLQKANIQVNFSQGLDTKTDPKQVKLGKFLELDNSVFGTDGLWKKRNGYEELPSLPSTDYGYLSTFNDNLTAIGNDLVAFSEPSGTWVSKGVVKPIQINTTSLVKNTYNQIQSDIAITDAGLACVVYTEQSYVNGVSTLSYKYAIFNLETGQAIVNPTNIPTLIGTVSGSPRAFVLSSHFVVVYTARSGGTDRLQYISIPTISPTATPIVHTISTLYQANQRLSFDGVIANNALYLAWHGSGNTVRTTFIDASLIQHSTSVTTGVNADILTIAADTSGTTPNLYVAAYDQTGTNGYIIGYNQLLVQTLAPTQFITAEPVLNLTISANNSLVTALYEVSNSYTYDPSTPTNYIKKNTITFTGTVGTASVFKRSVGLASKIFTYAGRDYTAVVYSSPTQPSYFLLDDSARIVGKWAYANGAGYYDRGLPNTTLVGSVVNFSYLLKDLIQSVNKNIAADSVNGVYTQTGISALSVDLNPNNSIGLTTSEIGGSLQISGGVVLAYDGQTPVEFGFFVWPDNVKASSVANPTPTGDTSLGSNVIINLSSLTNVVEGMNISGANIPASTTVTKILSANSVQISNAATGNGVGTTLTFTGNVVAQQTFYQFIYEWTDNQGNIIRSAPSIPLEVTPTTSQVVINIPTLRLTYKTSTPVRIIGYKWTVSQQSFYQVTPIDRPILNNTAVDSVTFEDIYDDAQIIGNPLIYTTGGVVENISPPATDTITLYKSRLFLVDAEDRNLLWYSKQVIEATPVEMSDLFTVYVAPTTGAQGATGPITALSALDDKLIIFKQNAIYYMVGVGPDNTGANNDLSDPVFITATVGCTNQQSIVFSPNGLMFQSDKGIWLLGRDLSTKYIGASVEKYTSNAKVQSSVNVPGTNQVRFTLDSGITLVYDYYYDQWGTFTGVSCVSSTLYNSKHTFINKYGKVYREKEGYYQDGSVPVNRSFTTSWLNLAGLQGFERAYEFYLLGSYISPHKLSIEIAYDYAPSPSQITVITPDNYSPPWGGDALWGSGQAWGGPGTLEQWRVFLKKQKCQAFQITVKEIYDSTVGPAPGAGLTLSGIDLTVGVKAGVPKLRASRQVG